MTPLNKKILTLEQLAVFYYKKQVLFDLSLTIQENQVTAIIGASGCGKSTLLRCINRMNDEINGFTCKGKIIFQNENILMHAIDTASLRRQIGMVFQQPTPFPLSVYDNVAYGLKLEKRWSHYQLDELVESSLVRAGLWNEVKDRLHQDARDLSLGQQQRMVIARALAIQPTILLLDEPTSLLDPMASLIIEELINELKNDITLILVTHNIQQAARVSDHTAFIHKGRMIEYTKTDLMFTSPQQIETEKFITGRLVEN